LFEDEHLFMSSFYSTFRFLTIIQKFAFYESLPLVMSLTKCVMIGETEDSRN
jgi:hypothetical protein